MKSGIIYDFGKNKCKYIVNHCNIKNWCWKPTIVKNSSGSNLDDIYDAIEAGRISSNVKEFWFKYYTIFSQDLQSYRQNQIESFKRILKLFEINDRSTVIFQNFSIINRKFVDASTEFIVNAKKNYICI